MACGQGIDPTYVDIGLLPNVARCAPLFPETACSNGRVCGGPVQTACADCRAGVPIRRIRP